MAQLALNTLKTPIVEPDDNTISITDANGNVVATGGQVNYVVTASRQPFAKAIDDTETSGTGLNQVNGYIVELGEQLYNGKLELRNNGLDDFGRPARTWVYNGTEIGSYAKKELLVPGGTYTVSVKGKTIYELLGQTAIRDNTLYTYLDGARNTKIVKDNLVRSYDADLYGTGRGVLTEVYLDNDRDELYIVSINTWLAKASVDYNTKSESITLTVYNGSNGSSVSKRVDVEDAPFITNMKKDDWCLVQWNGDVLDGSADKVVSEAFDVEIREDQKVTAFKRDKTEYNGQINENQGTRVTEITTGGETYSNNAQAWYKYDTLNDFDSSALVNKTYTVFMDQYGYFIGAELYSGKDQYVFITGYDVKGSNISNNTATAAAIFTDGTMQAIDVNVKDTNSNITAWNKKSHTGNPVGYAEWKGGLNNGNNQEEMWYKYTENRGVYTLTPVDGYTKDINETGKEREVDSSKVYLSYQNTAGKFGTGNSHGEDASIYITVNNGTVDNMAAGDDPITDVTGVYTGAQDVNLIVPQNNWIHAVWKDNYIVAAIVYGEAEGSVNNYAYIRSGINKEWIENTENGDVHYWEFDAVMDGETVTKTIKSKFSSTVNELKPEQVQELILDNDGYVTKIKDVAYIGNICDNLTENDIASGKLTKLYDNLKFRDSYVNGTDTLKGKDVYHVETSLDNGKYDKNGNYYLYNGGRQGYEVGVGTQNAEMPTLISGTSYTNMNFQGNTLHYNAAGNDLGLPVDRNAKAAVSQIINNKTVWENYDSVASAFNVLNDANDDSTDGKQFDGEIIAVLDSRGVAAWVVFIDNTPTSGRNDSYGDSSYDYKNQYGIKFRVHNGGETGRDVDGRVDRYGDLFVYVPVSTKRAAPADITVEVNVNGRHVGYATYMNTSGGYHEYKFADRGLDVNTDDILVIVTRAEKVEKIEAEIRVVGTGVTVERDEIVYVGDTFTVKNSDTDKYEYDVDGADRVSGDTWKITDAVVIVTVKEIGESKPHKDAYKTTFMGEEVWMWVDENGNLNILPVKDWPAPKTRAASMPIPSGLKPGRVYSVTLGGLVWSSYYEGGALVLKPEGNKTPEEIRDEFVSEVTKPGAEAVVGIKPALTGEPTVKKNTEGKITEVNIDLGQPMKPGAVLPEEITVDDSLNAIIVWKDTEGNVIERNEEGELVAADGATYTYEVVMSPAKDAETGEANEFAPSVTVVAKDSAGNEVKTEVTVEEGGIKVDEEGKAEDTAPVEPAKKWIITVDGPKEGVDVTGADNLDAVPDGTVITVTPVEGYTVKVGEEELTAAKKITVTDNVTIYVVKNPEKAVYELTLKVPGTEVPVYADTVKVEAKSKKTVVDTTTKKESTVAVYDITEGASVLIMGKNMTAGSYEVGDAKVAVTIDKDSDVTFKMPASAFELSLTGAAPEGSEKVYVVTVQGGVQAEWNLAATTTTEAKSGTLSEGENTVPNGAKITITNVGEGEVVLKDVTSCNVPAKETTAAEEPQVIFSEKDGENEITVEGANIKLYSATTVTNKTSKATTGIVLGAASNGKVNDTPANEKYVAIGEQVVIAAETGKSYFTNVADGKTAPKEYSAENITAVQGKYVVTVSGNKAISIFEGYKVTADNGIVVKINENQIPNTVYVKSGKTIKTSSPSGTAVTTLSNTQMAWAETASNAKTGENETKIFTEGAVSTDLNLHLGYQITLDENVSKVYWANRQMSETDMGNELTITASNENTVWALEGTWILAEGATVAPTATGVDNIALGTKGTVFQVGTKAISVLVGEAEATNETSGVSGTLENVLAKAQDGDKIKLNGNAGLKNVVNIEKDIVLDLNEKTLTANTKATMITIVGEVSISNGTIIGMQTGSAGLGAINVKDGANLTLNNVVVEADGCIFVGTYYSSAQKENIKTATLTINGGELNAVNGKTGWAGSVAIYTGGNQQGGCHKIVANGTVINGGAEALYLPGIADVTLNDCTATGYNGVSIKSGTLTINGGTVKGTGKYGIAEDAAFNTNGSDKTGAAISVFEQNPVYAGYVKINVTGNATLESTGMKNNLNVTGIYVAKNGTETSAASEGDNSEAANNTIVTYGNTEYTRSGVTANDATKNGRIEGIVWFDTCEVKSSEG